MPCPTCRASVDGPVCRMCGTPTPDPVVWAGVPLRRVRGVGIAASVAVVVAALARVAVDLYPLVARKVALSARETEDVDAVSQAVLLEGVLLLASLVPLLVAGVLVVIWLYRARRNIDAFPGATASMRPGWAIGGWFVPIANMVVPGMVLLDVARSSRVGRRGTALIAVWWAGFIGWNVISAFIGSLDGAEFDALPTELDRAAYDQYADYWAGETVRNLFELVPMAVAAVAIILVILWISRAQEERIALAEAVPWQPTALGGYAAQPSPVYPPLPAEHQPTPSPYPPTPAPYPPTSATPAGAPLAPYPPTSAAPTGAPSVPPAPPAASPTPPAAYGTGVPGPPAFSAAEPERPQVPDTAWSGGGPASGTTPTWPGVPQPGRVADEGSGPAAGPPPPG